MKERPGHEKRLIRFLHFVSPRMLYEELARNRNSKVVQEGVEVIKTRLRGSLVIYQLASSHVRVILSGSGVALAAANMVISACVATNC